MGLLGTDTLVTLTRPHRDLIELLEGLGLEVVIEVSFPPYLIDCYLPDLHVGVEADGPMHSRAKDEIRDDRLMASYALPIYRLTAEELQGSDAAQTLLRQVLYEVWHESVIERRMLARGEGAGI